MSDASPIQISVPGRMEVAVQSGGVQVQVNDPARKLPEGREERLLAYASAVKRLAEVFSRFGFFIMSQSAFSCAASKGPIVVEFKVEDNLANMAYVTSSVDYDPTKAGRKDSNATIQSGKGPLKSRDRLRVIVSGNNAVPIFFELRQNIPDPELHICKGVMFVLQLALDRDSSMHKALKSVDNLKGVPAEWLPTPGMEQAYPELEDLIRNSRPPLSSAPPSLPRWESEPALEPGPVIDV